MNYKNNIVLDEIFYEHVYGGIAHGKFIRGNFKSVERT